MDEAMWYAMCIFYLRKLYGWTSTDIQCTCSDELKFFPFRSTCVIQLIAVVHKYRDTHTLTQRHRAPIRFVHVIHIYYTVRKWKEKVISAILQRFTKMQGYWACCHLVSLDFPKIFHFTICGRLLMAHSLIFSAFDLNVGNPYPGFFFVLQIHSGVNFSIKKDSFG